MGRGANGNSSPPSSALSASRAKSQRGHGSEAGRRLSEQHRRGAHQHHDGQQIHQAPGLRGSAAASSSPANDGGTDSTHTTAPMITKGPSTPTDHGPRSSNGTVAVVSAARDPAATPKKISTALQPRATDQMGVSGGEKLPARSVRSGSWCPSAGRVPRSRSTASSGSPRPRPRPTRPAESSTTSRDRAGVQVVRQRLGVLALPAWCTSQGQLRYRPGPSRHMQPTAHRRSVAPAVEPTAVPPRPLDDLADAPVAAQAQQPLDDAPACHRGSEIRSPCRTADHSFTGSASLASRGIVVGTLTARPLEGRAASARSHRCSLCNGCRAGRSPRARLRSPPPGR